MSSPSTPTAPETTTHIDRARESPMITPFHDDPYVLVRQAYTPIATDTKFEPFEETQPLSPRASPLSPNYTPTSPDYTPDTPHTDEESEPMEASKTRNASPSDSTSPLSPDHPLPIQTSPTPTLLRPCYYRSTSRMPVRTQPALPPGLSARVIEVMALSPLSFRKRYRGTSELIADLDTESEESDDESTNSKSEEAASEDQQQAVPIEDTSADVPLGLGYGAARRRALELAEDTARNTFEVGQSSRSVPDQQRADETPTPRLLVRFTWENLVDGTVYTDIEYVMPPVRVPVQTPSSPEWSSGSLPVSSTSLTLELHGSILHDHIERLDALPHTLIEGFGWDISELLDRSGAVRDEIHSQRFKIRSLEQGHARATTTFSALWQPVLALKAWARQSDN
ncbi:hypothetical protein Tco_0949333 [Tanacetum coccineum]